MGGRERGGEGKKRRGRREERENVEERERARERENSRERGRGCERERENTRERERARERENLRERGRGCERENTRERERVWEREKGRGCKRGFEAVGRRCGETERTGENFFSLPLFSVAKNPRGTALRGGPCWVSGLGRRPGYDKYPLPPAPQELVLNFHDRNDGIHDDSCLFADSDDDGVCVRRFMKHYDVRDVFMSSAPNSGAECIVMAKQRGLERFIFCRPGDAVWAPVRASYEVYEVVAFWNGRFYAVDHDEDVFAL